MPELPEVETIKTALEKAISQAIIIDIDIYNKNLREKIPDDFSEKIRGLKILSLERRAKYILLHLEQDFCLILHLGMSGKIKIYNQNYNREKHDHVVIKTSKGIVAFNDARRFGLLTYETEKNLPYSKFLKRLGIEPFDPNLNEIYLLKKLASKKTAIKVALLDQSVIVGIGNIYASEALYAARIHPERTANSLTKAECKCLIDNVRIVLKKAIEAGGSTLKDYQKPDGSLGYFQNLHCVYNKQGYPCPDCKCNIAKTGGIQKIVQGGRSTFFCPVKQK